LIGKTARIHWYGLVLSLCKFVKESSCFIKCDEIFLVSEGMFALGRGFCCVKTEAKGAVKDIKHEYYGMTQMYV